MKTQNKKNEAIYFFRSERNTKHNHGFFNPSKFFIEIVSEISYRDISIIRFVGVVDDAGNKMNVSAKEIHDFENGKRGRLVFDWDGIYDTSYYVRESDLTDDEKNMTGLFE